MGTMTEAERIAAVCEWLGMDARCWYGRTQENWWSREGCWKALEAWKGRPAKYSWVKVVLVEKECRVFLYGDRTPLDGTGTADTLPPAALAALTEAMED